jgi:hypothetical protein
VRCNQCEALIINGVYCHEIGCPNARKTFVKGRGWVKSRECRECGSIVEEGECCDRVGI